MIHRAMVLLSISGLVLLPGCKDPIQTPPPAQPPAGSAAKAAAPDTKAAPAPVSERSADAAKAALGPGVAGVAPASGPSGAGYTRTPSGLEYEVLSEGQGESPPLGSRVFVHYTGMLPNRTSFADTRGSSVPQEFKLDRMRLIDGWVEALLSMKKGEKRKLKVPSPLAYGQRGYAGLVPPNTDLTFELELVAFTPPAGRAPGR